jgi:hypothetical protein
MSRDDAPDPPPRELPERAARYVERAGVTDRRERFRQRMAAIRRQEERRRSRQRRLDVLLVAALVVLPPVAGGVVAEVVGIVVGMGVALGVLVGLGLVVLRAGARRYADRRGATAWDWRSRRYVVRGHPSRDVQAMSGRGTDRGFPTGGGRRPG